MEYQTQTKSTWVHPDDPPSIQHDNVSMPFTLVRQTDIQMPMLDEETTFTALFILEDDVPVTMINDVLIQVNERTKAYNVWLADSVVSLTEEDQVATEVPIDESWQSPFAGYSVEEAFKYLATVSVENSLNRTYIIVLNKALYEQKNWVVIYRIDENGEITSIPCVAQMAMVHIDSYSWHIWPECLEQWHKHGWPIFSSKYI